MLKMSPREREGEKCRDARKRWREERRRKGVEKRTVEEPMGVISVARSRIGIIYNSSRKLSRVESMQK